MLVWLPFSVNDCQNVKSNTLQFYGPKITKNKNIKLNIENGVFYIGKNLFCLSLWRRIFLMQEFARHVQEKCPFISGLQSWGIILNS
jgi:hypothetical protein